MSEMVMVLHRLCTREPKVLRCVLQLHTELCGLEQGWGDRLGTGQHILSKCGFLGSPSALCHSRLQTLPIYQPPELSTGTHSPPLPCPQQICHVPTGPGALQRQKQSLATEHKELQPLPRAGAHQMFALCCEKVFSPPGSTSALSQALTHAPYL